MRAKLEEWEVIQIPYLETMPNTTLFSLLGELAKARGLKEIQRFFRDPDEILRIRSILKTRITKAEERLAYHRRDLKDFEDLIKRLDFKEVKL